MSKVRGITSVLIIGLMIFVLFFAKHTDPPDITKEELEKTAASYFRDNYGKEISVKRVYPIQTGYHAHINCAEVSENGREYKLFLDGKNRPYADNVKAVSALENKEEILHKIRDFLNRELPLLQYEDVKLSEITDIKNELARAHCALRIDFKYEYLKCNDKKDFVVLLGFLKELNIQEVYTAVAAPEAFAVGENIRNADFGFQWFYTSTPCFLTRMKYTRFQNGLRFDESELSRIADTLQNSGCMVSRFGWASERNRYYVDIYCETNGQYGHDELELILQELKPRAISLKGKTVYYRIVQNGKK